MTKARRIQILLAAVTIVLAVGAYLYFSRPALYVSCHGGKLVITTDASERIHYECIKETVG